MGGIMEVGEAIVSPSIRTRAGFFFAGVGKQLHVKHAGTTCAETTLLLRGDERTK
jgi:hypothetical protein